MTDTTNDRLEDLRAWLDTQPKVPDGIEQWCADLSDAITELLWRRRNDSERRFAPKRDE